MNDVSDLLEDSEKDLVRPSLYGFAFGGLVLWGFGAFGGLVRLGFLMVWHSRMATTTTLTPMLLRRSLGQR